MCGVRLLLVHPGATWSTADVYDGLLYGLRCHGADVVTYRLDTRIEASHKALHALWRTKKKTQPDLAKPNTADIVYHAGIGVLEMALRHQVDVVLVVSAMLLHPDAVLLMKFKTVNPNTGYLPHAWHPLKHFQSAKSIGDLPSHDVVFVGSGFPERVTWFNSIDWTGIDLGLYGTWKGFGLNKQVLACVRSTPIANETAGSLYRRTKIGLNLYRRIKGFHRDNPRITHAESLSPRAYELAACGSFHISEYRAEVKEVFGDCVPTFTSPAEASDLIRSWLDRPEERARVAAALPACVAEASWVDRAKTVLGDLSRLIHHKAA
ncbi:MAG: putative CgeB family protein [Propionibacteriaceae bacterium]|nr:putative CgeB family protein [Propionibacteriaceae bacterium]